jgi:hypothetical protein
MKKVINELNVVGRVYEHELKIKQVQNENSSNYGKNYISGKIHIAIDEDGINVIPVYVTYIAETTKDGGKNKSFALLKELVDNNLTWIEQGKDGAMKISVLGSVVEKSFYNENNELISTKQNEASVFTKVNKFSTNDTDRNYPRAKFKVDSVVFSLKRIEADEDKGITEDYAVVKCGLFNWRNELYIMDFKIYNPQGIEYFENLEPSGSNPVFIQLYGGVNCQTVTLEKETPTAFGKPIVEQVTRTTREWIIESASSTPFEYGEEGALTAEELKQCVADRELRLAELKKRTEEWRADRAKTPVAPAAIPIIKTDSYNF